jgi:hypothetical protein
MFFVINGTTRKMNHIELIKLSLKEMQYLMKMIVKVEIGLPEQQIGFIV